MKSNNCVHLPIIVSKYASKGKKLLAKEKLHRNVIVLS